MLVHCLLNLKKTCDTKPDLWNMTSQTVPRNVIRVSTRIISSSNTETDLSTSVSTDLSEWQLLICTPAFNHKLKKFCISRGFSAIETSQKDRRNKNWAMKRLLHGTLRLKKSPTGEQIQNGRPTDETPRDPITPWCGPPLLCLCFSLAETSVLKIS